MRKILVLCTWVFFGILEKNRKDHHHSAKELFFRNNLYGKKRIRQSPLIPKTFEAWLSGKRNVQITLKVTLEFDLDLLENSLSCAKVMQHRSSSVTYYLLGVTQLNISFLSLHVLTSLKGKVEIILKYASNHFLVN